MIRVQLHGQQELVITNAMIDVGASEDFIDKEICSKHGIETTRVKKPREIYLADRKHSTMGPVTPIARVPREIDSHQEMAIFQVANLKNHELILGMPWLQRHNPNIEWEERKITFDSERCSTECLETSLRVHAVREAEALEENLITRQSYMETEKEKILVKRKIPEAKFVGWVDVVDVRELVLFSDARRC